MKHLSDFELLAKTLTAAKNEQSATLILLEYLTEVRARRLYLECGYPSLFEYIVLELRYSESQAWERISALKLMEAVPEIKTHLENGELNLSGVAHLQRFKKLEEKGNPEFKIEAIIPQCLNQSKRDVEKILIKNATHETKAKLKEKVKSTADDTYEVHCQVKKTNLERAKELARYDSIADLMDQALAALIEKKEKQLGKVTSPAKCGEVIQIKNPNSRYIPQKVKQAIYQRSKGQCEHIDAQKNRCTSRQHLEVDHITPFAQGGPTTPENLRHLCRAHNQYFAVKMSIMQTQFYTL